MWMAVEKCECWLPTEQCMKHGERKRKKLILCSETTKRLFQCCLDNTSDNPLCIILYRQERECSFISLKSNQHPLLAGEREICWV